MQASFCERMARASTLAPSSLDVDASRLAPQALSSLTSSAFPAAMAASSGVSPCLLAAEASAPLSRSALATSRCPGLHASSRGVFPSWSTTSTSANARKSRETTAASPRSAATCRTKLLPHRARASLKHMRAFPSSSSPNETPSSRAAAHPLPLLTSPAISQSKNSTSDKLNQSSTSASMPQLASGSNAGSSKMCGAGRTRSSPQTRPNETLLPGNSSSGAPARHAGARRNTYRSIGEAAAKASRVRMATARKMAALRQPVTSISATPGHVAATHARTCSTSAARSRRQPRRSTEARFAPATRAKSASTPDPDTCVS